MLNTSVTTVGKSHDSHRGSPTQRQHPKSRQIVIEGNDSADAAAIAGLPFAFARATNPSGRRSQPASHYGQAASDTSDNDDEEAADDLVAQQQKLQLLRQQQQLQEKRLRQQKQQEEQQRRCDSIHLLPLQCSIASQLVTPGLLASTLMITSVHSSKHAMQTHMVCAAHWVCPAMRSIIINCMQVDMLQRMLLAKSNKTQGRDLLQELTHDGD